MFCTKCGAQNPDGAAFCHSCGNKLDGATQPSSTPAQGGIASHSIQGKSQPVAAVLNFFFGLGYLYLGYKRVLGVPAAVFVVLTIVVYVILGALTAGIAAFVLAILLAVDGWQKAGGAKGFVSAQ